MKARSDLGSTPAAAGGPQEAIPFADRSGRAPEAFRHGGRHRAGEPGGDGAWGPRRSSGAQVWLPAAWSGVAEVPAPRAAAGLSGRPVVVVEVGQAVRFLRQFHRENPAAGPVEPRIAEVTAQIAATGTYRHTAPELAFGARLAWRNEGRCIGRLYWRNLVVRDRRAVTDPRGVFEECVEHLLEAGNGGRIRPVITVFAPDGPTGAGPRIRNDQLISYAGYLRPDGTVVGDPKRVGLTDEAVRDGWTGPGGPFDVLPLMIDCPGHGRLPAQLPAEAVLEVPIRHPQIRFRCFDALGLRWYALPAIANMDLHIGGITYGCAPFNGWYMGTEIGARNLADAKRYDLLPVIAAEMGLDTSRERNLWRDKAMVELNIAVLHSFEAAGVTITDHHTESARMIAHIDREARHGRTVPGDWSWLVPPMSGSQSPLFHRHYDTARVAPAFTARGEPAPNPPPGVCPVTGLR
jgi:nitric-oxide synthase